MIIIKGVSFVTDSNVHQYQSAFRRIREKKSYNSEHESSLELDVGSGALFARDWTSGRTQRALYLILEQLWTRHVHHESRFPRYQTE